MARQARSASQQPRCRERPPAALFRPIAEPSVSQPMEEPSDQEVYLDSDSDLLVLTTWAGRPAASHAAPAYAFARRTPFLPPDLPVSPCAGCRPCDYAGAILTVAGWYSAL